jgi:hypothetical protein
MIDINLDPALHQVVGDLDQLSKPVQQASKRALRKLLRWLRGQVLRQVSRETGVKQKTLKQYQRVQVQLNGMEGRLWLGLNPLPLHEAGRVSWRPSSQGARVARETYEGAFYRAVYGNTPKVWIRAARNQQLGHPTYHKLRAASTFSGQVSGGRFPVQLLGMPLADAAQELDRRLSQKAEQRFKTILAQELNFVLSRL